MASRGTHPQSKGGQGTTRDKTVGLGGRMTSVYEPFYIILHFILRDIFLIQNKNNRKALPQVATEPVFFGLQSGPVKLLILNFSQLKCSMKSRGKKHKI